MKERTAAGREGGGAVKQVVAVAGAREERERERGKGDSTTEGRTNAGRGSERAGGQIYGGERGGRTRTDAAPLNCGSNSFLKQQQHWMKRRVKK